MLSANDCSRPQINNSCVNKGIHSISQNSVAKFQSAAKAHQTAECGDSGSKPQAGHESSAQLRCETRIADVETAIVQDHSRIDT